MSKRRSDEDQLFYYRTAQRVAAMMYWSFGEVLNSSILEGKRHLTRERFYKSALCHDVISREEYNRMKAIMRGQWRKKLPETQNASI